MRCGRAVRRLMNPLGLTKPAIPLGPCLLRCGVGQLRRGNTQRPSLMNHPILTRPMELRKTSVFVAVLQLSSQNSCSCRPSIDEVRVLLRELLRAIAPSILPLHPALFHLELRLNHLFMSISSCTHGEPRSALWEAYAPGQRGD